MSRNYSIDNAKVLLIFFVVFGHLISSIPASESKAIIFGFIYSFHMPAFILLAGLFYDKDRYDVSSDVSKYLITFMTFNILYEVYILAQTGSISYFTSVIAPNYLMWFLWSLFIWRFSAKILLTFKYPISLSILISLVVSTVPYSGLFLEISRTASFLPFFVFGAKYKNLILNIPQGRIIHITSFIGILALSYLWYIIDWKVDLFFGFTSLPNMGYEITTGLIQKCLAILYSLTFSLLLISVMPKKRFFFTGIGVATLDIYLFHGFITLNSWLQTPLHYLNNEYGEVYAWLTISVMSVLMVYIFSRQCFVKLRLYLTQFTSKLLLK